MYLKITEIKRIPSNNINNFVLIHFLYVLYDTVRDGSKGRRLGRSKNIMQEAF